MKKGTYIFPFGDIDEMFDNPPSVYVRNLIVIITFLIAYIFNQFAFLLLVVIGSIGSIIVLANPKDLKVNLWVILMPMVWALVLGGLIYKASNYIINGPLNKFNIWLNKLFKK